MRVLKTTFSLCPECLRVLPATIYEQDGKVYIKKTCPEHGEFDDLYWGDYELYKKFDEWWFEGNGIENPRTKTEKGCPFDCGICPQHKTHTILAIIDVTNRCNMRCPICFAYTGMPVYEPSLEQIKEMLYNLRANKPLPAPALQLSGGEPTLRDDLPEIVRLAKEAGFKHVEVNTNGIRIAKDINYFKKLIDAGMSTLYLQFDALRPEPYYVLRGLNVLPLKLKVIENARKLGFSSIVLVVTLAKGVNDSDVGDIIRFAAENSDVVRCVNVQPISFAGAGKREDIKNMRITIPDFLKLVEQQTNGQIKVEDFRPVTWPVPFARLAEVLKGKCYPEFTMSPHCGAATLFIVEDGGKITPVTRLADVDKFAKTLLKAAEELSSGKKVKGKLKTLSALRYIKGKLLRQMIFDIIKSGTYEALGKFMRKVVMIGCMHFMDPWNFDLERMKRCAIHYATVDGRIIPFCSMNSIHRASYEAKYSMPYELWLAKRREQLAQAAAATA
ncbi:MAG: radical SAM protein [Candidatus Methanomethylicota archaeon]|uniref:Radical SAM protein n=2 Tax=Thermoproteota archaeon TaxID=2056631 RepID=A0A497EN87_9CREN|nr:MAG: radical SAM protein [Candidatus Verstraetearchaeota archaeon]